MEACAYAGRVTFSRRKDLETEPETNIFGQISILQETAKVKGQFQHIDTVGCRAFIPMYSRCFDTGVVCETSQVGCRDFNACWGTSSN